MPTCAKQMEILKDIQIRGYSHYTTSKLIDLLIKSGLIPEKEILLNKKKQRRILIIIYFFKADTQQSKQGWDTWFGNRQGCYLSCYIQSCFGLGSQ